MSAERRIKKVFVELEFCDGLGLTQLTMLRLF